MTDSSSTEASSIDPITEADIVRLVTTFYDRARRHEQLGPVFNSAVSDWDHHIGIVADFWSKALLGTARYQGHPFPVHMNLPIRREHFEQWLELFRQAARDTLSEDGARAAIGRAEFMAESFRAGLFPLDPVRRGLPRAGNTGASDGQA